MSYLTRATPTSPEACLWALLTTLKTSVLGGTSRYVRTSSTGSLYSQAGDVWASSSVLLNAGAWAVLRGRPVQDGPDAFWPEWCFQVNGAGGLCVFFSPRAGFLLTGSVGLTRRPEAADEKPVIGGGTAASPSYRSFFPSTPPRMIGWASEFDDTFWFLTYPVGGGAASSLFFCDSPRDLPRDSYGRARDRAPLIAYAENGGSCALEASLASEATGPRSAFAYGDQSSPSKELWGRCPADLSYVRDSGGVLRPVFPGGGSTALIWPSPTYPEALLRYVRRAGVAGTTLPGEVGNNATTDEKGFSSFLSWAGGPAASSPFLLDRTDPLTGGAEKGVAVAVGNLVISGWDGTPLDQ